MTQPVKAQEPSMEEILASIRRIISDDETKTASEAKPAPVQAASQPKPEPSSRPRAGALTSAQRSAPSPSAPASGQTKPAPKPAAPPPPTAKNSQNDIDAMLAGLGAETSVSEARAPNPESDVFELTEQMAIADRSSASAQEATSFQQVSPRGDNEFSGLDTFAAADVPPGRPLISSSTMTSVESAFNTLANTVLSNNARTLEDLVKEMLRPMLKSWLDDNLPNMVERIVRAEIERASRGR